MSLWDLKQELRPKLPTSAAPREKAFVQVGRERAYLNAPVEESLSLSVEDFYTSFHGRMVAADTNLNLATWTKDDLHHGMPSVIGGPVNFLHDQNTVVGAITDASIVPEYNGPEYIQITGRLWNWIAPEVIDRFVNEYNTSGAWLSMECVPEVIECLGCGTAVSFDRATDPSKQCEHMNPRTAPMRMVNPVFLGVALIVPPESPGWPGARVEWVSRQVASLSRLEGGTSS